MPVVLGNSIYERLATAPPGFPIQHTRLARLLRGAVISRDPDFTGGNVVVTQTGLRDPRYATSEKGPLDESAVVEFVRVTPLDILRGLSGATFVPMRQPAHLRHRYHTPRLRRLD
jgi:hypothetical protein